MPTCGLSRRRTCPDREQPLTEVITEGRRTAPRQKVGEPSGASATDGPAWSRKRSVFHSESHCGKEESTTPIISNDDGRCRCRCFSIAAAQRSNGSMGGSIQRMPCERVLSSSYSYLLDAIISLPDCVCNFMRLRRNNLCDAFVQV